jgi:hypothetical protein
VCGARMYGWRKEGRLRYACRAPGDGRAYAGCGAVSIAARPLEEYVRDALAAGVDWDTVQRHLTQRDRPGQSETLEELERLEAAMDELADDYAEGRLSRDGYQRATRRVETRLETVKASIRGQQEANVIASLPGSETAFVAKWEGATESWRRRVVELLINHVTVSSAAVRGGRFDPSRVRIVWRV